MKALFRKELGVLRPEGQMAEDAMRKIKLGSVVMVEVKQPRNPAHLRKWWALMQIVADNLPGNYSAETVCEVIKIRIGHVTPVQTAKGIIYIPKTISFAIDQAAFNEFYDRAVNYICAELLPGLGIETLTEEVNEMVA